MADDLTIETYLDALDHHLRRRHDRDDLVAEVEDHLRSSVERQMLSGIDPATAQKVTISRFGDPEVVALALAEASGSPAVPTSFTKTAGSIAIVGALGWFAFPILWWIGTQLDKTQDWNGTPQTFFVLGVAALLVGITTTVVLGIALHQRFGGLGSRAMVALVVAAIALAAATIAGWFIYGWSALLLVATSLVVTAVWPRGLAPRAPLVLAILAWPLALLTRVWLEAVEFGAVDEWGDRWEANVIGLGVGAACTAVALAGIGAWLAGEEPVDTTQPGPVPA